MSFTHRLATRGDLAQIVDIYNATIPSRRVTADTEPVSVESRVKWFEDHQPDVRPLWVIDAEGYIAAWLSFSSFYGRPAYSKTGFSQPGTGFLFVDASADARTVDQTEHAARFHLRSQ